MSQQPISAIARIRYVCRDCHRSLERLEVIHLRDGGWLCRECFDDQTECRTRQGLPPLAVALREHDAL